MPYGIENNGETKNQEGAFPVEDYPIQNRIRSVSLLSESR